MPGYSNTAMYRVWRDIINRCENPNRRFYPIYGGRGITICARWRHSFQTFVADVGPRPSLKHSIDRIDNDGNYEPSNVRWATRTEQVNNRRNTRFVEYRGQRMPLTDAVRAAGSVIHREAAWIRIKTGWPAEQALETPRTCESPNSVTRKVRVLTGQRFGRLTAVRSVGRNKHYWLLWLFRCDCGTEKTARAYDVVRGRTKICGRMCPCKGTASERAADRLPKPKQAVSEKEAA